MFFETKSNNHNGTFGSLAYGNVILSKIEIMALTQLFRSVKAMAASAFPEPL